MDKLSFEVADIHETPCINFFDHEERKIRVRSGAQRRVGRRTGTIYDVSKTSICRSLTPIVAFHAVRVSLPKLYCRKADFTRARSLLYPRSFSSLLLQRKRGKGGGGEREEEEGVTVGVVTSVRRVPTSNTRMSFAGSREPTGSTRHLLLLSLPSRHPFTRLLASP